MSDTAPLLRTRQIADALGVSDRTVQRWLATYPVATTIRRGGPCPIRQVAAADLCQFLDRYYPVLPLRMSREAAMAAIMGVAQ